MTADQPEPSTSDAAYQVGYQQALNDIARAVLDSTERGSSRAALQWCERSLTNPTTRVLVSAALLRMSARDQGDPYDDDY